MRKNRYQLHLLFLQTTIKGIFYADLKNMTDPKSSPAARAERLRRVRGLANLSRHQLCEQEGINYNTLRGWELGRFGGLTENGAKRVCLRLAEEGVVCTPGWLLYEIGSPPEVNPISLEYQPSIILDDAEPDQKKESKWVTEEIQLFRSHYARALDFVVTDESMFPQFEIGDIVAGIKTTQFDSLIGKVAIVVLKEGETLLRQVHQDPQHPNRFMLLATNVSAGLPHSVLTNIKIHAAARVLWHRKPFIKD